MYKTYVKKAYRRLSLKVHPDRVADDEKESATRKFQTLGKIYAILSDTEKRAVYDESGIVDEEDMPLDRDWCDYWRKLFVPVTMQEIKNFEKAYKGSDEELDHLKEAYLTHEGDMEDIINSVFCASIDDEPRFRKILKELIANEELEDFAAFSKEGKRRRAERMKRAASERAEAEEMKQELGLDLSEDSLAMMIRKRNAERQDDAEGFIAHLEKKYAPKSKTKAKKGK